MRSSGCVDSFLFQSEDEHKICVVIYFILKNFIGVLREVVRSLKCFFHSNLGSFYLNFIVVVFKIFNKTYMLRNNEHVLLNRNICFITEFG